MASNDLLHQKTKMFWDLLAAGLAEYGFVKKTRQGNGFIRATDAGSVCIFVFSKRYAATFVDFWFSAAATSVIVSENMQKISRYHEPNFQKDPIVWAFGAMLDNIIRDSKKSFFDMFRKFKFETSKVEIDKDFSEVQMKQLSDEVLKNLVTYAIPYLEKYGTTNEKIFEFATSKTDLSASSFMVDTKKSVIAIILALHLGKQNQIPSIIKRTRSWFKKVDRLDALDEFNSVLKEMNL